MPTLALRTEPSVRQTNAILTRVETELAARGATVERVGAGALRFAMPRPWIARHLGLLQAITSGRVALSAGAGERWRVRYELSYAVLRGITVVLSIVLVAVGWQWSRVALVNALLALWAGLYGLPYFLAGRQFRELVAAAAREVVERRRGARDDGEPAADPANGSVNGSIVGSSTGLATGAIAADPPVQPIVPTPSAATERRVE